MNVDIETYRVRIGLHSGGTTLRHSVTKVNIINELGPAILVYLIPFLVYVLKLNIPALVCFWDWFTVNDAALRSTFALYLIFTRIIEMNCVTKTYLALILLLSGDIETNPGDTTGDLTICHINAQSILNKLELIAVELGDFDIITVSETWLGQSISSTEIMLPGYQEPIRLDRNRQGGGVAIYFKNSVPFVERNDLTVQNVEAVWGEVNLCNRKVLIGSFYIHPRFRKWELVELSVEQALQSCPNIVLLGDFNQNMLDTRKNQNILSIMDTYDLHQLIDTPTGITANSASIIDLILTTDSLNCTDKGVIDPFCSDHCAVHFSTNFMSTKQHSYKRKIWQYEKANYNLYREKLRESNWDMNNLTIDDQVKKISENILHSAEFSIPNKEVTIRPKDQPWIHNEIRKAIRHRKRLHKTAKRTNNPVDWANFRQARNHVISLIHNSKLNYFNKLAENLQRGNISSKNWWKIAKRFISSNKKEDIPLLIKDNVHYCNPDEKANVINQYFTEQSTVDDSNATLPPHEPPNSILENIILSEQDILDVLGLLDINKANGPDLINPKLLKEGACVLAPYLANIFNASLSTSYFPTEWKLANVIPVFKKGDKTDVSNHRPISLLSCIGKVFERCVFKHLHNYLITNNLITSVQSGFTPKDSAVYQLTDIYNTFVKAIDDGKEVRVVFCDISKAFDRVWHRGLLFKLRRMGISGSLLSWFSSYLDQRKQRVAIEGCLSDILFVKAGVPQGSILGPLLFLMYINDIVEDIGSYIKLFADDTSLYMIVEDPNSTADLMDADLRKIHSWAKQWLVKFNANKTEELIISRKTKPPIHPQLSMDNTPVNRVTQHKHLGLIFNNQCTWHEHICEITAKAWKRIHILRSLQFQLDRRSLQILYFSYIRPILEYGDIIWDNCFEYEKEKVEKIQIEAGRIVTGATKSCSVSKIYEETQWDTLDKRRYNHRMITYFKMTRKNTPSYLYTLLPPVSIRSVREICEVDPIFIFQDREQLCTKIHLSLKRLKNGTLFLIISKYVLLLTHLNNILIETLKMCPNIIT